MVDPLLAWIAIVEMTTTTVATITIVMIRTNKNEDHHAVKEAVKQLDVCYFSLIFVMSFTNFV